MFEERLKRALFMLFQTGREIRGHGQGADQRGLAHAARADDGYESAHLFIRGDGRLDLPNTPGNVELSLHEARTQVVVEGLVRPQVK